jgi:ABC-type transport system substrate-binding protein
VAGRRPHGPARLLRPALLTRALLGLVAVVSLSGCLGASSPTAAPPAASAGPKRASVEPRASTGPPASVVPEVEASSSRPPAASAQASLSAPSQTALTPSSTPEPVASPRPTRKPISRSAHTMVVIASDHPRHLLPPAANPTEALLIDLLYDPLYRLDEQRRAVPELARDLPEVSADGLTWRIPIRSDARFDDGTKVTPEDVLFSLRLAASPSCPLGRDLCDAVGDHLARPPERDKDTIVVTLADPYAPFLADALGRLPILSESAVAKATEALVDAAGKLAEDRPDAVVNDITEQMLRPACAEANPPEGCRLVDHRARLERVYERAGLQLPSEAPYTDETGRFDEETYVGDLLERLGALGQVFTTADADKRAAALALLDVTALPVGSGPYRLMEVDEDGTYVLAANEDHTRRVPDIDRIVVEVERDPSVAVTRLLSGDADWILEVGPEYVDAVSDVEGIVAAPRPIDVQQGILFNVRPGRVYSDREARRAFVACIDHDGLARQLDADRAVATTPYAAGSWAEPAAAPQGRDVAAANAILDAAGWVPGADGIRERAGIRLSSTIAVRPTGVDLFTFANAAATQLKDCGIELSVEELDLTGGTMLEQLLWPNDFDTLLLSRTLGPDPDGAVRAFESSRITTEENQADANPSGFTSALADHLIADARGTLDTAKRAADYAGIQDLLAQDVPYWPLWYESDVSALSSRVRDANGKAIDPAAPHFDWDVASWTLAADGG